MLFIVLIIFTHFMFVFFAAAINAGKLIAFWNLPHYSYSSTDPALADREMYSTMIRLMSPFNNLADALVLIYKHYKVMLNRFYSKVIHNYNVKYRGYLYYNAGVHSAAISSLNVINISMSNLYVERNSMT